MTVLKDAQDAIRSCADIKDALQAACDQIERLENEVAELRAENARVEATADDLYNQLQELEL